MSIPRLKRMLITSDGNYDKVRRKTAEPFNTFGQIKTVILIF